MSGKATSQTDPEAFTYQGRTIKRAEYLGDRELGPLGDQFIECPKCSERLHKFSIRCPFCGSVFREIGKIDSGPRGSATKGIGFVVGVLVLALSAMVLGERGGEAYGMAGSVAMAAVGFVLGVNGLLGLLYFRYFAVMTFLRGLLGFGVGAVSFIVGVLLLVLLI